jgi:hypothetical protein
MRPPPRLVPPGGYIFHKTIPGASHGGAAVEQGDTGQTSLPELNHMWTHYGLLAATRSESNEHINYLDVSLWYLYGISMVSLWYLYGLCQLCHDVIFVCVLRHSLR